MDAAEFANKFAAKSLDYDAFEYSELINVIKGCDDQLRTTFFRNATAINLSDLCKEIAVKTVCYTIAKIPAYNFNQCIKDIDYKTAIGSLLLGNETLNTWVVKRFIESIVDSETLTDEFKNAIFKIITASGYVWGTTNEISTGNRQKAILLFDFVKIYYPEEKYAEFYDIYYKENAVATEFIAQTDPFFSYLGDDRLSRGIKADVEEAINKQTNVRDYVVEEKAHSYYCAGEAYTVPAVVYTHHEYDVGADVLTWLNGDTVKNYDLRSDYSLNNHIHNVDKKTEHSGGGCVTGETLITMKDGKEVPIINLTAGMEVRSASGVSVLSDEFIVNKRLKTLYGINDMKPFMSLEHAVMTTQGWKSLDPVTSNRINPHYNVTILREGDEVMTQNGIQKVDKITIKQALPGQNFTGYDLHFADGEKSYYANGLLVLLNYPEITLSRLMRALERMKVSHRRRFFTIFQKEQSLFEEVFSEELVSYFKESAYEQFEDDFCEQS